MTVYTHYRTHTPRAQPTTHPTQFLFRAGDIGGAKSVVAVRAAQAMNPALKARGVVWCGGLID